MEPDDATAINEIYMICSGPKESSWHHTILKKKYKIKQFIINIWNKVIEWWLNYSKRGNILLLHCLFQNSLCPNILWVIQEC